tara:strand:+ start:74036 stop:74584 length:549 start_codon:yes stop_codon:yes gene_type:complete
MFNGQTFSLTSGGVSSMSASGSGTDSLTWSASWQAAPFGAYMNFTSTDAFDLALLDYMPSAQNSDVSGYILSLLDAPAGNELTRFTTNFNFCSAAGIQGGGLCNLVTGAANSGGNANSAAQPGDLLFANLAAGSYRLGFYESATPAAGSVQFGITTAVPAPASLLLLGAGLLALGLSRRKAA